MNKRVLTWLLCLSLLLALPLLAGAQQPEPDQLFGSSLYEANDNIASLVIHEGRLLMLADQGLYSWQPGEEGARKAASLVRTYQLGPDKEPSVRSLFVRDGKLLGLDELQGILWQLSVDEGKLHYQEALKLDWSSLIISDGENSYVDSPQYVLMAGDRLFFKATNWGNEREKDLFSFDLSTGAITSYSPRHYQSLVPYKDGTFIGVYFDQNEMDPVTHRQLDAVAKVFDPDKDSQSDLPLKLPTESRNQNRSLRLYYHAAQDKVYAATETGLYRLSETEEAVKVARLPMAGSWFSSNTTPTMVPLSEDRLAINFGGNVFIRGLDEKAMQPVVSLTVNSGHMDSQALTLSQMAMDDIEVLNYQGQWMDNEAIMTQFMTGAMPLDLIDLDTRGNDVQRLMQKGYLLDLPDDKGLSQLGQDSFDMMKRAMYHKDRLYLLPVSIDTTMMSAYPQYFKNIGREIPQSYPELLDLVRWWADEGHQQHEGYVLFDQPDAQRILKELAFSLYMDSFFGQNKPLVFEAGAFGKLMQEIEAIDFSKFDLKQEDLSEEDSGMMPGKTLIMTYMGYSLSDTSPDGTGDIKLSLDGKMPAYRQAIVRLVGIPATTKHPEEAKRLLLNYLNNRRPEERAAVSQAWDQPIENPFYERQLADTQRSLKDYQRLHDEAEEGVQKRQYALDVQQMERQLAKAEENWRYRVSTAAIERNRELMTRLYVDDSLSLVANAALSKDGYLFHMYLEGAITLEQFVQQANDKIRLMTLEAQ